MSQVTIMCDLTLYNHSYYMVYFSSSGSIPPRWLLFEYMDHFTMLVNILASGSM